MYLYKGVPTLIRNWKIQMLYVDNHKGHQGLSIRWCPISSFVVFGHRRSICTTYHTWVPNIRLHWRWWKQVLYLTAKWCNLRGLSLNPEKNTLVSFTRRRNFIVVWSTLNGFTFELSHDVKFFWSHPSLGINIISILATMP